MFTSFWQFRQLNSQKDFVIDRAWWTSVLILICFHATDIPMFDSRINILGWILLIGLRCMISQSSSNLDEIKFRKS